MSNRLKEELDAKIKEVEENFKFAKDAVEDVAFDILDDLAQDRSEASDEAKHKVDMLQMYSFDMGALYQQLIELRRAREQIEKFTTEPEPRQ